MFKPLQFFLCLALAIHGHGAMAKSSQTKSVLFTPGPIATSQTVKASMAYDMGARDSDFLDITLNVRNNLIRLAGVEKSHTAVLLQGSGSYAVEAMIGTLVPRDKELLILVNGNCGKRIKKICEVIGQPFRVIESSANQSIDLEALDQMLTNDSTISHVAVVHSETTSGQLNPIDKVSDIVKKHNKALLIDAMSSFGGVPIDSAKVKYQGLVGSANKGIQGIPGLAYAIINKMDLASRKDKAHSLSLDLHAQWENFEKTGQWRFTPPVQTVLALNQALIELEKEGGIPARYERYKNNCELLDLGLTQRGFKRYIDKSLQGPIVLTYHVPQDPNYKFDVFYEDLKNQGYVIFPGKLTEEETFRIGCIGDIHEQDIKGVLAAIEQTMDKMNLKHLG